MARFWKSWNTDRIVGFSAIFISLLTLVTFIYQTNLMKQQTALSVLPYLAVSSSYSNGSNPSFKLVLINQGVGPAIIESQQIVFQGKTYREGFFEFIVEQIPGVDTLSGTSYGSMGYGTVLPSGDEIYLIASFGNQDAVDLISSRIEELNNSDLKYEIIYRSIYDERWKITEDSDLPIKLSKQ